MERISLFDYFDSTNDVEFATILFLMSVKESLGHYDMQVCNPYYFRGKR